MTEVNIKEKIKELEDRRAELLYTLCEKDDVHIPQILLQMVFELRSITTMIKFLKGENQETFKRG